MSSVPTEGPCKADCATRVILGFTKGRNNNSFSVFFSPRKYWLFGKSNKYFSGNLPSDFEYNFRTNPYSIIVHLYGAPGLNVLFLCYLEKERFIKMRAMAQKSWRFDSIYPSRILNNVNPNNNVNPDDFLSPADVIMDTVDPFQNKHAVQCVSDHHSCIVL